MKKTNVILRNKQLRIILLVVVAAIAVTGVLTVRAVLSSMQKFDGDGYILVPSEQADATTDVNEQYYFAAGTNYQEKFGTTVSFRDTSNNKVKTDTTEYIHYLDGSLASFTKGVVMSLSDVANEQVTYYGVSDKTTILKSSQSYEMSYLGDALQMNEFIWKLSDNTYMVVAPQITLHMGDDAQVNLEDYVQIQYVDGGIVRLVHQQGTYQTVADNSFLVTDGGVQLNLTEKAFYMNGVETLSLNDMVIDSSDNLKVDEDESVKIPNFNVVNGKDGTSGEDGTTGSDGDSGNDGTNGEGGTAGDAGKGGYDGAEGNGGDWGYDGKDGSAGTDAPNATSTDGIASIDQKKAPTVSLDTEHYTVGPNSVSMNLAISDPNDMLETDLTWKIYERSSMAEKASGIISRGVTSAAITTNALAPDTEYVIVVSGTYTTGSNTYDADLFTKIFATDTLGIRLEKVQVTNDSIMVQTTVEDESKVGTYQIALFDESENKISSYTTIYSEGQQFIFDSNRGLVNGTVLTPNTGYTVKLTNIISKDNAAIGADVSLPVMTLKTTPYFDDGTGGTISIAATNATAVSSERYQTVTVSLDTAINDVDNGITGYRYELYKVSTVGQDPTSEPDQIKEVKGMQNVTFNVDKEQNYVGRVVVLFADNEKDVELPSGYSSIVSLANTSYPVVSFVSMSHNYDKIEGYIMVKDTQNMLQGNISADYPMVLTMVSEAGNPISVSMYTSATDPTGGANGTDVTYYKFSQDGLRRNTKYALSVSGPVNDTGLSWDSLTSQQKQVCAQYYLAGVNVDTGDPTKFVAQFKTNNTGSNLFAVNFGISATADGEADYEAENLEKVSFRLINTATGAQIGTDATFVDSNPQKHESDFAEVYSAAGTTPDNQVYSEDYVLTDASFGVAGDNRIASGGTFAIVVQYGSDYTSNDAEYPDYTNNLDWEATSMTYNFEVQKRHTQASNVNDTIAVNKITNENAPEEHKESGMEADTVVGLNLVPEYQQEDVTSVTYYIYENGTDTSKALVTQDTTLYGSNIADADAVLVGQKTVIVSNSGAGLPLPSWTVYFADTDAASATGNLADDGTTRLFERGKKYFVRYEVTTDGSLSDSVSNPKYPDCVYPGIMAADIPYYRSQVFAINRQTPQVARYLWDTVTAGTTTQEWRYLLTDPDNAVLAETDDVATVVAHVQSYADFDHAAVAESGTSLTDASLSALFTGDVLKTDYAAVSVSGLTDGTFYTVSIPYQLCTGNSTELTEEPFEVSAITEMNTDIIKSGYPTTAVDHKDNSDYAVSGLMVKGIGTEAGLVDDNGYRIRLTLQGSEIYKVAALKVTLTEKTASNPKTIVYDPVEVTIADGTAGTAANSYGYAYLDYAPIVKAGMNSMDVTVKVEAYYNTNQAGMASYMAYTGHAVSDIYTDNAAGESAWALKQLSYGMGEELTYDYNYQKISDSNGTLTACPLVAQNVNDTDNRIHTLTGSVMLPTIDADAKGNGFTGNVLSFRYALASLCTSTTEDGSYLDVLGTTSMNVAMDQIGMHDIVSGSYYILEKLALKQLELDCGTEAADYATAEFHTGDGMPGVKYAASSSIGMKSATINFETKGAVPNTADQSMYLYLYDVSGTKIALQKYKDADDNFYYLVQGATPTTDRDTLVTAADDGTEADYGSLIVKKNDTDIDGTISFAVRGLESNKKYYVMIQAKDTQNRLLDLFDYQRQQGGYHYEFTTTKAIQMSADDPQWSYRLYNSKLGTMQFGLEGSEGTGMRIFYKLYRVYDNQEITWGNTTGNRYDTEKGYLIEPLGNNIKYYHSDKSQNNPVNISFNPGVLELNTQYKVVMTAYASDNNGTITDNTSIGTLSKTFTTPAGLKEPRASIRVVPSETSLDITVVMTDTNKVIVGNQYIIEIYNKDGSKVEGKTFNGTENETNVSTVKQTVDGLTTDTPYTVRVTAKVDMNNDNATDGTDYVNSVATSTVSAATASVVTQVEDAGVLITLRDCANFEQVTSMIYSIDSEDGNQNFANASTAKTDWTDNNGTLSLQTGFVPSGTGNTYAYTIQYYDAAGSLLGTSSGYFSK